MRILVTALAGVGALLVSGCIAIRRPAEDLAEAQLVLPEQFAAETASGPTAVRDHWIDDFDDDRLVALVAAAIAHNPDLEVAAARWEEARARLVVAGSFLRPRLDAFASARRSDSGDLPPHSRYDVGAQIGWEPDLWGRIRADEAAAVERAAATGHAFEYARQSLAAAVADGWFLAIAARRQLGIDMDLVDAEQFTAQVTRDKIELGAASRLEADIAEANLALAEAAARQSEAALVEARQALEILIGRYPQGALELAPELPPVPPPPPVGLPSELLERRPDVVAADRLVAAAFHDLQSARAARLPRVQLTASLGAVLDPSEAIWSLGANLLAPLFTGGQLDGDIRITSALQRQALAQYVAVALTAFREVEAALANERILALRQQQLEIAAARLRSASRIAEDRYHAGIIGILDLTQVRRQDFETRSQLLRVRTERLRQRVDLYLALGGSFAQESTP